MVYTGDIIHMCTNQIHFQLSPLHPPSSQCSQQQLFCNNIWEIKEQKNQARHNQIILLTYYINIIPYTTYVKQYRRNFGILNSKIYTTVDT